MVREIAIPDQSLPDHTRQVEPGTRTRIKFFELARSRIIYRNKEEHLEFERRVFGSK